MADQVLARSLRRSVTDVLADEVEQSLIDDVVAAVIAVCEPRITMYREQAVAFQEAANRAQPELAARREAVLERQRAAIRKQAEQYRGATRPGTAS